MTTFSPQSPQESITDDLLLLFSAEFSAVKSKDQLTTIIDSWLKDVLLFNQSTIFIVNSEHGLYFDFLSQSGLSAITWPFKSTLHIKNRRGQVASASQLSSIPDVHEFIIPEMVAQFKEGLIIPLNQGDKPVGFWVMLYNNSAATAREQQMLIRLIANQLTIVTQMLLAEEITIEREIEAEIIQSLNIDFASIKEKKDLLKIIHFKLKRLFDFGHQWVAVINEDQLSMTSFLQDEHSQVKDHPKYQQVINTKYTTNDRIFNKVLLSKEPFVFDLQQLSQRSSLPGYLEILYESGISKVVMVGLQVGARIIGVWAICLVEDQTMDCRQLNLISGIANQLSIAVDNIIINQSIKQKEAEAELLLKLSYDISTIRSKKDLVRVINTDLRKIFDFESILIFMLNGEYNQDSFILSSVPDHKTPKMDGPANINEHTLNCLNRVLQTEGAQVFDMEQLYHQETSPESVKQEFLNGIKEKVTVSLKDGDTYLGMFCVNSNVKGGYTDHDLDLIKGVAYQISTAVSNIIANEEISRREAERELLLSMSIDIGAVRNTNELLLMMNNRFKGMLGFTHTAILTINKDRTAVHAFLKDPESKSRNHPRYAELSKSGFPAKDGVLDKVIDQSKPMLVDLNSFGQESDLPLYMKVNQESGIKQSIVVRLSKGAEMYGFWLIFFEKECVNYGNKLNLIESLANLISVAVLNIIADQKISNQLNEINNYRKQLEEEKTYLREELEISHNYAEIIGDGPAMQQTFKLVAQVASSDSTVLILGETGTGKELIARAIHNTSPRKNKLMVKVNCAALPANLIESELFGHERGSFTGATERRVGKFELANGGTLFLDEIGEMPFDLQSKLLRALQEREIERIGGKDVIKVDVRIIVATNRRLEKEMEEGRFRSDLYYRLNIFPIEIPPLRQRKEDIFLLATHFINRFAKKAGRKIKMISKKALLDMQSYDWPGNVREMEHLIERSILLSEGNTLKTIHLPTLRIKTPSSTEKKEFEVKTIDENERIHIIEMLKYCNGRVGGFRGAAELLDVPASTLFSKMKKLGIKRNIAAD
ncbi:Transcriptional regulator containing GAF, AAA-type ATPase, and DNA-binding Fis domains [Mucilaginibacter gossypiicola]|uniref:Transcriptional regulator containing GAF, AAA-type ATPase, and DNA-binding Fis domains n=1 Tax=Mucilaginibacter gossypiicola TaxID=551995 RepID=A0A1H8M5B8_9SPHI|nr:sigma 54-interacting transcriptional regulator [Mucilaginibacter gossypiicola]SEO12336.1 Transcriptional regulator containing GAF, AAA-type ATPase, and DNA-binding Fis domains [Mucilaginibacter gossypiicola]